MLSSQVLDMASYLFNILGIVVCLVGLTLAKRVERRPLGLSLAVLGFLIAASPLFTRLFGLVTVTPAPLLPGS